MFLRRSLFRLLPWTRAHTTVVLHDTDLEEKFVKGGGKGGQKINTTSNRVDLLHVPTGLRVACQETRSLDQNRKIARKLLWHKLDDMVNGEQSKNALQIQRVQERKRRRQQKARKKYGDGK
jgi:protein subunit release factor A